MEFCCVTKFSVSLYNTTYKYMCIYILIYTIMSINTHLYFTCFTSHGKSPESPQPVRSSFPLHPPPHTSMADPVESSGHSDEGWTQGSHGGRPIQRPIHCLWLFIYLSLPFCLTKFWGVVGICSWCSCFFGRILFTIGDGLSLDHGELPEGNLDICCNQLQLQNPQRICFPRICMYVCKYVSK